MEDVPAASHGWLIAFVNAYARAPREAAGVEDPPVRDNLSGGPEVATRLDVDAAAVLADELWQVFAADEPAAQKAHLNRLLDRARIMPVLRGHADLGWRSTHTDPIGVLRASCTSTLLQAALDLGWSRIGTCAAVDCVDVFIDDEQRRARRYCSPTCLNRTRVRTHRRRRRLS